MEVLKVKVYSTDTKNFGRIIREIMKLPDVEGAACLTDEDFDKAFPGMRVVNDVGDDEESEL